MSHVKGDLKYNIFEISFMVFPGVLPLSGRLLFPEVLPWFHFGKQWWETSFLYSSDCGDCDSAMQMGTYPGHLDFVKEPDGGDTNNDPLSQTLTVLSFNLHFLLIGIVTVGEVYLHSLSASNGGDNAGSFQGIAKHIVTVDLLSNTTWSALLSQLCGRGLWGRRCRKVKWLS